MFPPVASDPSRTIVFLDLTRFTALTDAHGDDAAAEVVDRFVDAVTAAVVGRGRLVKTLGDGVLLEARDAAAAIEVADDVSHRLHDAEAMPEVTGGIATGSVVDRGDDVLGAVVNLAARLSDLATPGELRVTEHAARAAADAGWQVEPLGTTEIRGFHDPVRGLPRPALPPRGLRHRPRLWHADHPRGGHPRRHRRWRVHLVLLGDLPGTVPVRSGSLPAVDHVIRVALLALLPFAANFPDAALVEFGDGLLIGSGSAVSASLA